VNKIKVYFRLPRGGSGIPANLAANEISVAVLLWCTQHGVEYNSLNLQRDTGKMRLKSEFAPEDLAVFKLTWDRPDITWIAV
jgi:hypothetical protein